MDSLYDELRIVLHGVWRRRWLALAVAWGIAVVGWLVVSLIPNRYESRARVFVQVQSLLPSKIGMAPGDQQQNLDRVRQTLGSSENLAKVVSGSELSRQVAGDADLAAAIDTVRKSITVTAQQDNLVEIKAVMRAAGLSDGANARLAQQVVQSLIDIFVEQNIAAGRDENEGTLRFLDDELKRRGTELQAAEQRRVEFEQKYLGVLPGVGSAAQRLDAARMELSQIESNLMAAQGALAAINGQMAGTPAMIPGPGGGGGAIAALQGQLADAAAKGWTDQHPDVVATRAQIARLRASGTGGATTGGGSANPAYLQMRSMQAERQATAAALSTRKAQIEADMAQFAAKQAEEPEVAAEQQRLSRDYEVQKAQYDKLLGDREDVRLRSDVATKTDAVKFRVIDPPSLPRLPASPNRPLLLAGVLVLALGGGTGAAFAMTRLRTTYATPERLSAGTGMAVLGGISAVRTDAAREERRRHDRWFAGGAAGLAAAFVLLLAVEFVQRGLVA